MSLPNREDILKMDYSYKGSPFVQVATKPGMNLYGLNYSYKGEIFFGLEFDYTKKIIIIT